MYSIRRFTQVIITLSIAMFTSIGLATPQANHTSAGVPVHHWETANGAQVYFTPTPNLPIIDVVAAFYAGSAHDGEQSGKAALTNAMLVEGAGQWDVEAIAEKTAQLGADIDYGVGRDSAYLSLRTLSEAKLLQPALELFTTILSQPTFPEEGLERRRIGTLNTLKYQEQSPGATVNKLFYQTLYQQHPYSQPVLGTHDSVAQLTQNDLAQFHQSYYVANNLVLAITGDLNQQQAKQISERISQSLPTGQQAQLPEVENQAEQAQTVQKPFPSTQTHIVLGQIGINHHDPDYFPLYVGNYVLGGSNNMGSLLFRKIRKQHGLAYHVSSNFAPLAAKGPFSINLQTRNDQAEQAIELVNETLKQFSEEGPTAEALANAKQYLIGSFPLSFTSNQAIVSQLATLGLYQLPLDYFEQFPRKIEAVTAEQIQTAFAKHVDPDSLLTITVGNG